MSDASFLIPETRVLAIASHSLGCDVAALNTVQFSNHTGYGKWKGSRVTAEEISELYDGLKQSYLDDFDMMLSGYIPGAAAVEAVGKIGLDLRRRAEKKPGSFFWVLDPVMGDNGKLYVAPEVVPAYKSIIQYADLISPNKFEAEQLSDVKITDMASLKNAVSELHSRYRIPHIIITSVSLDSPSGNSDAKQLCVVGSTCTSDYKARFFKVRFPAIDCYFSGTGDMFGALTVVRMREAVQNSSAELRNTASWVSPDDVQPTDLPLARAAEKIVASLHEVLEKTVEGMDKAMENIEIDTGATQGNGQLKAARSKAAELKLVRNMGSLKHPNVKFRAENA
ncbi:pyridoxal kinase [Ceratocystis lukuohia]|uniref:pyridoxal kinase n=1 Tax=Ceratocystis lukuohia TaxID=2019550 RepID=A0ABR4MM62_9PEZI